MALEQQKAIEIDACQKHMDPSRMLYGLSSIGFARQEYAAV